MGIEKKKKNKEKEEREKEEIKKKRGKRRDFCSFTSRKNPSSIIVRKARSKFYDLHPEAAIKA